MDGMTAENAKYGVAYKILSAQQQVVAGINYKIVTQPELIGECEVIGIIYLRKCFLF